MDKCTHFIGAHNFPRQFQVNWMEQKIYGDDGGDGATGSSPTDFGANTFINYPEIFYREKSHDKFRQRRLVHGEKARIVFYAIFAVVYFIAQSRVSTQSHTQRHRHTHEQ